MGWPSGYGYKKTLTIDHTKVTADCTDFPILVSITDVLLKDTGHSGHVQNTSGYDIVFQDSTDTTALYHEIESYDGTNGILVFWVKSSISATSDVVINMYYGKSGVTVNPSSTSTWDTNYKAVYHHTTTASLTDSTVNANNATLTGTGVSTATGKINGGINYTGLTQNGGYYTTPNLFGADIPRVTYETFICPDVVTGDIGALSIGSAVQMPCVSIYASAIWTILKINATDYRYSAQAITATTWQQLTISYNDDDDIIRYYYNGAQVGTNTTAGGNALMNHVWWIGMYSSTAHKFDGIMDETRFSNTQRTAGWISTEYANINSPGTFLAVGTETQSVANTFASPELLGLKEISTVLRKHIVSYPELLGLTEILKKGYGPKKIESLGLTEVLMKRPGKGIIEKLGLKEVMTYVKGTGSHNWVVPVSELLGLKELTVTNANFKPVFLENIGLIDVFIRAAKTQRAYNELLGLTDGSETKEYFIRSFIENFGLSDSLKTKAMQTLTAIEKMGLFDTFSTAKGTGYTFAERLGLNDSTATKAMFLRMINELLGLKETTEKNARYIRTFIDFLGLTDISSYNAIKFYSSPEKIGLVDVFIKKSKYERPFPETLSILESTVNNAYFIRALTEILALTETSVTSEKYARSYMELLGLKELLYAVYGSHKINHTSPESLGFFDDKIPIHLMPRSFTEIIGLNEMLIKNVSFKKTYNELVGLFDAMQYFRRLTVSYPESFGLFDALNTQSFHLNLFWAWEKIGLIDGKATIGRHVFGFAEKLGLTDAFVMNTFFAMLYAEQMGLVDSKTTFSVMSRIYAEKLGLTEIMTTGTYLGKNFISPEIIGLFDRWTKKSTYWRLYPEYVSLFDQMFPNKSGSIFLPIYETLGLSDYAGLPRFYVTVEIIGLKEMMQSKDFIARVYNEKLGLTETLIPASHYGRVYVEIIGLSDALGIRRWFKDVEALGLSDMCYPIKNYVYNNFGYIYEIDVYN